MRLHHWAGDTRQALEIGEHALALARELGWCEQLAFTLHDIHRLYQTLGQRERAWAALGEAQGLWRDLGNQPMLTDALASAADILYDRGELEPALACAEEAHQIGQSIGNQWGQAYSRMTIGCIRMERGEIGGAMAAMEDAVGLGRSAGLVIMEPRLLMDLAWTSVALGAIEAGRELLQLALIRLSKSSAWNRNLRSITMSLVSRLEARAGNLAVAEAALRDGYAALGLDIPAPDARQPRWLALAAGELALAKHDWAQTIVLMDALIPRLRKGERIYLPDA
jgi:tetratricopeptide (TPR) repeat protein